MSQVLYRIYYVGFYLISVCITTFGRVNLFLYCLMVAGILTFAAIAESLFSSDHEKLDLFVKKVRGLVKVMIAVIITVLLINWIF